MKKKWTILIAVIVTLVVVGIAAGPVMSRVEQPAYTVSSTENDIETRQYKPMIIAKVAVDGTRRASISNGFRVLADYIFGNNSVKKDIAMTAPVQQQTSQEIAMTAPVQQQAVDGNWSVSFVMPSEFTMDTLPKPNDERVVIEQVPAKTYVAITFSGSSSDENVTKHEDILMRYIAGKNLKPVASAKYAFYNPPWTLPFMRRNEVMVAIE